jgi:uncharacterized protein (TIRG00374 family)
MSAPSLARRLTGAAVSLLAIVGCVWWASRQDAPVLPSSAGALAALVGGVLVYGVAISLRGYRWHAILRRTELADAPTDACALTAVGYMGNTVLPARGGELLRMFLMADRANCGRLPVLGSIFTERALDAATLLLLLALVTALKPGASPVGQAPAYALAAIVPLALAAMLVYRRARRSGHLAALSARIRPFALSARLLLGPMGVLLGLLSVGIWLIEASVFWIVLRALDLPVDPLEAVAVSVVVSFLVLIPAGPAYVGTYDAGVLIALGGVGVGSSGAVGAGLVLRFVAFVPVTLVGLVILVARYGGLRELRAARRVRRVR